MPNLGLGLAGIIGSSNEKGTGTWVAVGGSANTTVAARTDGTGLWYTSTLPSSSVWTSVTYGRKTFVAVNNRGDFNSAAASFDAVNWINVTMPTVTGNQWKTVIYGNGMFVAGATQDVLASSPDGINWTARIAATAVNQWKDSAYGNGLFIMMPDSGRYYTYSSDGINWGFGQFPTSDTWLGIAFGNGKFILYKASNTYYTSTDGINWTSQTFPSAQQWRAAYYHEMGGVWNIFVNGSSSYLYSSSATTGSWISDSTGGPNLNWSEVAYGNQGVGMINGEAIGVGSNSTYSPYSFTGSGTWGSSTIANQAWNSIAYGKI